MNQWNFVSEVNKNKCYVFSTSKSHIIVITFTFILMKGEILQQYMWFISFILVFMYGDPLLFSFCWFSEKLSSKNRKENGGKFPVLKIFCKTACS